MAPELNISFKYKTMNTQKASIPSTFQPGGVLKNRHVQSILASAHFLAPSRAAFLDNSRQQIIETPGGSRLLAYLSRHPRARGLMTIIHGWEGSSSSAYVLASASFFYDRGLSVCRLNLRDHGDSHHLNEGLFHGALLKETFDAVSALAQNFQDMPFYLLGFSLGGNFALRIAIQNSLTPITNMAHVFAVSPPLDPYKTTQTIDSALPVYRKYFLKKWRRSLRKKMQLFPQKYDFTQMLQAGTCIDLTSDIMEYMPEFKSYHEYFKLYTLTGQSFSNLRVPVNIFISEDDPVIALEDFRSLQDNEYLTISRQRFGGHCGFIHLFPHSRWYNDMIANLLK